MRRATDAELFVVALALAAAWLAIFAGLTLAWIVAPVVVVTPRPEAHQ